MLLYLIKLPESVRWAWAVGKMGVARGVIQNVARFNKVDIPAEYLTVNEGQPKTEAAVGVSALLTCTPLRSRYPIHNMVLALS